MRLIFKYIYTPQRTFLTKKQQMTGWQKWKSDHDIMSRSDTTEPTHGLAGIPRKTLYGTRMLSELCHSCLYQHRDFDSSRKVRNKQKREPEKTITYLSCFIHLSPIYLPINANKNTVLDLSSATDSSRAFPCVPSSLCVRSVSCNT